MIKRLLILTASLAVFVFSIVPSTAWAINCSKEKPSTPAEAIQCGTDSSAGVPGAANPGKRIDTTIGNIVDLLSIIVGIAAVIMIIVAGFRYITSAGNQESVKSAKNTLIYAVIGLVIVALAQIIVAFVLDQAT